MNTLRDTPVIRVLTVDDHQLVREGIAAVLDGQPDMMLIGQASNGREAIESFRQHRPDVTLMDLRMPDMSGIEAIMAIRAEFPSARIIVLTTYAGDVQAAGALKAGASGYLRPYSCRHDCLEAGNSRRLNAPAADFRAPTERALASGRPSRSVVRTVANEP